jgi:hypothetical protein
MVPIAETETFQRFEQRCQRLAFAGEDGLKDQE